MLSLPLDPTDDRAQPAFRDAASCAQWLGQLQLTDLHQAHSVMRAQMNEFYRFPMRGLERLHALELLRESVSHLQADYARKLAAKKLPLNKEELAIFTSIMALWQLLVNSYQRCLQSLIVGDKQLVPYTALLCHRCLMYTGEQISGHLRTGYEFDGRLWQQLHALFAFSEERGVQLEEIGVMRQLHALYPISKEEAARLEQFSREAGAGGSTNCQAVYVTILLSCLARPEELSRSQSILLDRWLSGWCAEVAIERSPVVSKEDAPGLAVDLGSSHGLYVPDLAHWQSQPAESPIRYLAMVPLSKLLRVKTVLLHQGQSPQQLDLGDGYSSAECITLLKFLHQCWCEGKTERRSQTRRRSGQTAQVCYGLNDIFAHVANRPFRPGDSFVGIDSLARKQIATFGRVLADDSHRNPSHFGHVLESWQIEDESMLGSRLLRDEAEGARLGPGQLIAIKPADANAFILAAISWVHVSLSGQLRTGVRYLPGVARAVAVKSTGTASRGGGKAAALLLPAVDALKTPSSLVIPRNWFQPDLELVVTGQDGKKMRVNLVMSVESGQDFERVSYRVLTP